METKEVEIRIVVECRVEVKSCAEVARVEVVVSCGEAEVDRLGPDSVEVEVGQFETDSGEVG